MPCLNLKSKDNFTLNPLVSTYIFEYLPNEAETSKSVLESNYFVIMFHSLARNQFEIQNS